MKSEGKRILLVDDHPEHLDLTFYHLEQLGYDVRMCQSGAKALELVASWRPELMILDAMMPRMSGFDVLDRLRSATETATLPVIMLTALGDTETKVKALKHGADGFLSKPPQNVELKAKIESLLKLQEAHQTLERERAAFTAMLIHDLRSPLTSLGMFLELLEGEAMGAINEDQRSALESCRNSTARLLTIVNQVLDLSKIEAGQLHLEREDVTPAELLHMPLRNVNVRAQHKGVVLSEALETPDQPLSVDRNLMEQVLTNLLENAVRHTEADGTVEVRTFRRGDRYCFEVRDTGIGIAAEHLEAIFQPYRQVREKREGQGLGSGLGLAVSKLITDAHGGTISVESTVGEGSTFTVCLPLGPHS